MGIRQHFIGIYNPPFFVTLCGLMSGLWACIFSYASLVELAIVCFIMAGLCDLFDGVVARRLKRTKDEKLFGLHLDSVVDAISFGLVPVILLLHTGFTSIVDYFLFSIYCFSATTRLAYFNLLQARSKAMPGYYTGLPVTYSALVLPLALTVGVFLSDEMAGLLIRASLFLLAFFYVLDVKVKKPGGIFYVIFPVIGASLILFWLIRWSFKT